jgi:hypothetical protein
MKNVITFQNLDKRLDRTYIEVPLTSMDVGVFFHIGLLMKPFTTILARVGPGV